MKSDSVTLDSWVALNDYLKTASEEDCKTLIKKEQKGKNRPTFVKRIHSRLNRVRAERERKELVK